VAGYWVDSEPNPEYSGTFITGTSYEPTLPLPDGTHTVYVQAEDYTGNFSDVSSLTFTIDTNAPTVLDIIAAGSQWSDSFYEYLESQGMGVGGDSIASPGMPLPWLDIDRVGIEFDEELGELGTLNLSGATASEYDFTAQAPTVGPLPGSVIYMWESTSPMLFGFGRKREACYRTRSRMDCQSPYRYDTNDSTGYSERNPDYKASVHGWQTSRSPEQHRRTILALLGATMSERRLRTLFFRDGQLNRRNPRECKAPRRTKARQGKPLMRGCFLS